MLINKASILLILKLFDKRDNTRSLKRVYRLGEKNEHRSHVMILYPTGKNIVCAFSSDT